MQAILKRKNILIVSSLKLLAYQSAGWICNKSNSCSYWSIVHLVGLCCLGSSCIQLVRMWLCRLNCTVHLSLLKQKKLNLSSNSFTVIPMLCFNSRRHCHTIVSEVTSYTCTLWCIKAFVLEQNMQAHINILHKMYKDAVTDHKCTCWTITRSTNLKYNIPYSSKLWNPLPP